MKKTFLYLIILSLLLFNIFSLVRFNIFKHQKILSETIRNNLEGNQIEELFTYRSNFTTNILNSDLKLYDVMIKDSLSKIIPLKEIFNNKQKQILVFRFSQLNCESCVNSAIQILQKWVDSIGKKNVVFLGNYRDNRIFFKTAPFYGIQDMKLYNSPSFNFPIEDNGFPYYFILDSSLKISNVFVPNKGVPKITNIYLEFIKKKFSSNLDL